MFISITKGNNETDFLGKICFFNQKIIIMGIKKNSISYEKLDTRGKELNDVYLDVINDLKKSLKEKEEKFSDTENSISLLIYQPFSTITKNEVQKVVSSGGISLFLHNPNKDIAKISKILISSFVDMFTENISMLKVFMEVAHVISNNKEKIIEELLANTIEKL